MANYGMAFDYKLCINCHACEVACKEENGIDLGAKNHRLWIQEDGNVFGDFWNLQKDNIQFLQMQCQECEDAPCLKACPHEAIYRDSNGIVRLHKNLCDLTMACMYACPYEARYVDEKNHVTDKCIFCADTRLSRGEITTACQITCPAKLRYFGDLDDETSEISQVLSKRKYFTLKPELGTKPKLFYLT
ncbi:4Fe-4S dicluster domain-containing protein [Sulfurimonas sp.]|uniref:4Fe-4S dicluster domain-containing protein n=1 Tax=Sulfurimonas sp. TaxID=2022749 RepID=UPI00263621EF|nr:4Fe-4S dicluster domain-containing protein [Sulfurimonas sp.]